MLADDDLAGFLLGLGQDWGNVMELVELTQIAERPDLTIFKSNGLAVEDIIAAGYLYEKAVETGSGKDLPVFA